MHFTVMKWNQCVLEVREKPQVLNMTADFFLIYSKLAVTSINTSFGYFMVVFFSKKFQESLNRLWSHICDHVLLNVIIQ